MVRVRIQVGWYLINLYIKQICECALGTPNWAYEIFPSNDSCTFAPAIPVSSGVPMA